MPTPPQSLSRAQARRIALAAQGFADKRPVTVDSRALSRLLTRTQLLQIDSVNVLTRAHYLPVFSRLGSYDTEILDRASSQSPRQLFEYWGHEASLLRVELHPLLRWRMDRVNDDAWGGMLRAADQQPGLVGAVKQVVADFGPIRTADIEAHLGGPSTKPADGWGWRWSEAKRVVEYLFWAGEITSARRGTGFERWYDLPERVLPAQVVAAATPSPDEAHRQLIELAARSHGVGSEMCLRDYFRQPVAAVKKAIAELVEAGTLIPVRVDGWKRPAYLHAEARIPRSINATALLVPFDPLVFERARVEALFDFRYRIEIYTPAAKRVFGYYVLPFLMGDELVGRVDLKGDRQANVLRVQGAFAEPHAGPDTVEALAEQLSSLARWLGLAGVQVSPRGELGPALAAQFAQT